MTKQAVTLEVMNKAVRRVVAECNGNLPIVFKIRETAGELYGKEAVETHPELGAAEGAYLPNGDHRGRNRGIPHVYFQSSRVLYDDKARGGGEEGGEGGIGFEEGGEGGIGFEEAVRVARHEVLGHYGINTCSKEQKLNILEAIVDNQGDPELRKIWGSVEKNYPHQSKMGQAEEVFAFIAETNPKLDLNFSLQSKPFTLRHVEQIASRIAEGIRLGHRSQKIFPENNTAQFSKIAASNELLSVQYKWSKEDAKMVVSINGKSPSAINIGVLNNIVTRDKFLSHYTLQEIQIGLLDLKTAEGAQPVPKLYYMEGRTVALLIDNKTLKLN